MNTYYVITSRAEARRVVGKRVKWFGHFGGQYATNTLARRALKPEESWFDDSDPTMVVGITEVQTGPRSMRFVGFEAR
jgi:hypothetical protein